VGEVKKGRGISSMPKEVFKKTTGNLFSPPCPDLYIYLMKRVLREKLFQEKD